MLFRFRNGGEADYAYYKAGDSRLFDLAFNPGQLEDRDWAASFQEVDNVHERFKRIVVDVFTANGYSYTKAMYEIAEDLLFTERAHMDHAAAFWRCKAIGARIRFTYY